jgi:hypothetical protein
MFTAGSVIDVCIRTTLVAHMNGGSNKYITVIA